MNDEGVLPKLEPLTGGGLWKTAAAHRRGHRQTGCRRDPQPWGEQSFTAEAVRPAGNSWGPAPRWSPRGGAERGSGLPRSSTEDRSDHVCRPGVLTRPSTPGCLSSWRPRDDLGAAHWLTLLENLLLHTVQPPRQPPAPVSASGLGEAALACPSPGPQGTAGVGALWGSRVFPSVACCSASEKLYFESVIS